MELINKYFEGIVFQKVDAKEGYTIYAAGMAGMSMNGEKKYVLLFVPTYLAILDRSYISGLHWQNLQTRTFSKGGYKVRGQQWTYARNLPDPVLKLNERTQRHTSYLSVDIPIDCILLHDPKKSSKYQYYNNMPLSTCLNTFRCVITLQESFEFQGAGELDLPPTPIIL